MVTLIASLTAIAANTGAIKLVNVALYPLKKGGVKVSDLLVN
jgi:hypothetical protein